MVIRDDLKMSPGKSASQAAHAALMTFLRADPDRQRHYHKDGIGTKVCLKATDLAQLQVEHARAADLGLPHFLVEDSGRNTTFNGQTVVSALGIGPVYPEEAKAFQHLPLY